MRDALRVDEGIASDHFQTLGKGIVIIVETAFAETGILRRRIVLLNPTDRRFHARIVRSQPRIDQAFESRVRHTPITSQPPVGFLPRGILFSVDEGIEEPSVVAARLTSRRVCFRLKVLASAHED